jgi:hypothetical protein
MDALGVVGSCAACLLACFVCACACGGEDGGVREGVFVEN